MQNMENEHRSIVVKIKLKRKSIVRFALYLVIASKNELVVNVNLKSEEMLQL